jgi:exodeoxyribonuclease-3
MRIVCWNCNGAYRKKAEPILKYTPDIAVIPECEKIASEENNTFRWRGDNRNKGLGVFSYSNYNLKVHASYDPSFKHIIPIQVNGPTNFNLLAVWTKSTGDPRSRYIAQFWFAINYYTKLLEEKPVILIGDLNWNKIWDHAPLHGNLTKSVEFLKCKGIESAYHKINKEEFGKETNPTLFLQRNIKKPYHVDYCFASEELMKKINKIEVGKYDDWISYSDHVPIIIDFESP